VKSDDLKALQAPLKERYRERPESAIVTAEAVGVLRDEIVCEVRSSGRVTLAGLHPATGGDGTRACSADILLEALVACAGVTLSSVATAMGVDLQSATVRAVGRWDARGTLAVSRETPVGLTDIDLTFDLDTTADDRTKAKLIELTERYCVIYQTLRNPPSIHLQDGIHRQ
jgi:uncharacterized OsmC-like protein